MSTPSSTNDDDDWYNRSGSKMSLLAAADDAVTSNGSMSPAVRSGEFCGYSPSGSNICLFCATVDESAMNASAFRAIMLAMSLLVGNACGANATTTVSGRVATAMEQSVVFIGYLFFVSRGLCELLNYDQYDDCGVDANAYFSELAAVIQRVVVSPCQLSQRILV
jgi:hypothetical protein